MSSTKRKKVTKYRGSKTHGGGSMKKRRGAGSRGGRGRAGSGKRGDVKKPSYWKDADYGSGPRGFTSKSRTKDVDAINVRQLEEDLGLLVEAGHAKKSGSAFTVDLDAAGVDKLLGSGRITAKVTVSVKIATPTAIEKIEAAGGKVEQTGERKQKKAKSDASKPKEDVEDESDDE